MARLCVPITQASSSAVLLPSNLANGAIDPSRAISPGGGAVTMSDADAAMLAGSGKFTVLPPQGATSARPSTLAGCGPAGEFCDTTLGKVIFAQVWPPRSGIIVAWCDMLGNVGV